MFMVPSKSHAKAIFLPSGDQAGKAFRHLLRVRFLGSEPSAWIRKISPLPVRLETTSNSALASCGAGAALTRSAAQHMASMTGRNLMPNPRRGQWKEGVNGQPGRIIRHGKGPVQFFGVAVVPFARD